MGLLPALGPPGEYDWVEDGLVDGEEGNVKNVRRIEWGIRKRSGELGRVKGSYKNIGMQGLLDEMTSRGWGWRGGRGMV